MNRPLKFRQWVKGNFYYWGVGVDGCTFVGPSSGGGINAETTVSQQFTGLHDKTGKEIYEGDILERGDTRYPVAWDEDRFCFLVRGRPKGFGHYQALSRATQIAECEVIGNIFQNPELLEFQP